MFFHREAPAMNDQTKAERKAAQRAAGLAALQAWFNEARGNAAKLAAYLEVTQSTFNFWDRVMAERLGDVSNFTGIPREQLRPDMFEPPEPKEEPEDSLQNSA
jgi:hypothetical protein